MNKGTKYDDVIRFISGEFTPDEVIRGSSQDDLTELLEGDLVDRVFVIGICNLCKIFLIDFCDFTLFVLRPKLFFGCESCSPSVTRKLLQGKSTENRTSVRSTTRRF